MIVHAFRPAPRTPVVRIIRPAEAREWERVSQQSHPRAGAAQQYPSNSDYLSGESVICAATDDVRALLKRQAAEDAADEITC